MHKAFVLKSHFSPNKYGYRRGRASNRRIAVEWAGGEIRRLLADSIVIAPCHLLP